MQEPLGESRGLSEYQLRKMANAADFRLSHAQLWNSVEAGIIPPPDADHRWDNDAFAMLLASAMLAHEIPPLTHRAVVLYDHPSSHMPITAVREAMADVFPGIKDRDEKMQWVDAHARVIEDERPEINPPALLAMSGAAGWFPENGRVWGNVFSPIYQTFYEMRLAQWYEHAHRIEDEGGIDGVPMSREELRTIIAVRGVNAELALLADFAREGLIHVAEWAREMYERLRTGRASSDDATVRDTPETTTRRKNPAGAGR